MGHSQVATGMDRLPWLADEPAPGTKRGRSDVVAWAAAAIVMVAAISYWLGTTSGHSPPQVRAIHSTTVALPPAQSSQLPLPEVKRERVPEVEPIVAPPMPLVEAPVPARRPLIQPAPTPQPTDEVTGSPQEPATAAPADALEPWPVRVADGASGRLVRIGTFSTARKAKKGWWAIVRMNPALKRLPALVVPVRSLRNGRTYYRLQMGTTSQAHSAVLCQRMRMIAQSCVVIGVGSEAAK